MKYDTICARDHRHGSRHDLYDQIKVPLGKVVRCPSCGAPAVIVERSHSKKVYKKPSLKKGAR